jgi:pilus assembly protein CpaB
VRVVNLLVKPEQAEVLSLASTANGNRIQLVLRNPLDTELAQVAGTGMTQLFNAGGSPAEKPHTTAAVKPAPKPAPGMYAIEVFNGSQKSEQKFVVAEEKQ